MKSISNLVVFEPGETKEMSKAFAGGVKADLPDT